MKSQIGYTSHSILLVFLILTFDILEASGYYIEFSIWWRVVRQTYKIIIISIT